MTCGMWVTSLFPLVFFLPRFPGTSTGGKSYKPTRDNVLKGFYPISRNLYQYVAGDITKTEKDFLAFELGPDGQKIIAEEGFFPIKKEDQKRNALALKAIRKG